MQKKTPSSYPFVQSAISDIAQSLSKHISNCTEQSDKDRFIETLGLSGLENLSVEAITTHICLTTDSPCVKSNKSSVKPKVAHIKSQRGRPKKVKLDSRDVLVLHLRFLGKTFSQIANVFGWTRQAVHTRHLRATNLICNLAESSRQFVEASPILNYVKLP